MYAAGAQVQACDAADRARWGCRSPIFRFSIIVVIHTAGALDDAVVMSPPDRVDVEGVQGWTRRGT